jgi:Flp pilus assembly protein TadG
VKIDLNLKADQGATAIIIALCLVFLLGMAALAVDLGMGFNERRQDQSAADVGALAAAQFAKPIATAACSSYSGPTLARCNGAVAAMAVANNTLDTPASADWGNPAECAAPPALYTTSPNTSCVAFNANLQRAWVQVPTIEVPTVFGRAIGTNVINASADAIAITSFAHSNTVLPFLTPGVSATGNYDCLKTSGNPNWGVCEDLPSTGNFGSADYNIYGNEIEGSVEECGGNPNTKLLYNIANGVDHPLGIHPSGPPAGPNDIPDLAMCPIFSAEPNAVVGQPGIGSNLDAGLLQGGSVHSVGPYEGRIEDPTGVTVRNAGAGRPAAILDDTPLWTFLLPGLTGACSGVDTPIEMQACLGQAKSAGTVIFTLDIASAPRFGFTALMWENDFLTPGSTYRIKSFLPVYLDTTYFGCSAPPSPTTCGILHTPGLGNTPGNCPPLAREMTCGVPGNPGGNGLDAVTSYILSPAILPEEIRTPYPGAENQRSFALAR